MTAKYDENDDSLICASDEEEAVEFWLNENHGTIVEVDDNLCECAEWTVGERRCECGRRRMYAGCVEFSPGKYLVYPEAD